MHTGRPLNDVTADVLKAYREQRLRALEHQVRLVAGAAELRNAVGQFGWRPTERCAAVPSLLPSAMFPRPLHVNASGPSMHQMLSSANDAQHVVHHDSVTLSEHNTSSHNDRDAANRLLSLSPLASPALTASIGMLATPELMSIAIGEDIHQPLQLPASQLADSVAAHKQDADLLEYTDVSPTPTTDQFFDGAASIGTPEKWSEATLPVKPPAPSQPLPSCMKRTGSMLQMSHTLMTMANAQSHDDDDPACRSAKLPRRQSLTCLDVMSGLGARP